MNHHVIAALVMAHVFFASSASASPFIGTDLSVELGGHRWGFWSLIDTASHDNTSRAFRETQWLNDGSEEVAAQQFYSYWIIGLGPFGAAYVTRGLALVLAAAVALSLSVWLRRKSRGEHGEGGKASPGNS
jgi:hypothetical protein